MFWYDMGEAYLLTGEYEKAMKVTSAFVNNESVTKRRLPKPRRGSECRVCDKEQGNTLNVTPHPLSDTVNQFENQYFPALTADQHS
jgi:hypothetical protein